MKGRKHKSANPALSSESLAFWCRLHNQRKIVEISRPPKERICGWILTPEEGWEMPEWDSRFVAVEDGAILGLKIETGAPAMF